VWKVAQIYEYWSGGAVTMGKGKLSVGANWEGHLHHLLKIPSRAPRNISISQISAHE